MNLGDEFRFDLWLYNEMQKRGWDISDMAKKSGLTRVSIAYYIANGRMPNLTSFAMILKALGKHIEIVDN